MEGGDETWLRTSDNCPQSCGGLKRPSIKRSPKRVEIKNRGRRSRSLCPGQSPHLRVLAGTVYPANPTTDTNKAWLRKNVSSAFALSSRPREDFPIGCSKSSSLVTRTIATGLTGLR